MSWINEMFNSSLGRKLIMSLTGLFLCSFLLIHLIGNLQLLYNDQGVAFNQYAKFMTTNPLIKTTSYLLYFSILFHAFKGLYLVAQNRAARPSRYVAYQGKANSTWMSRSMGVLGTIILVFIVIHMGDFWYKYKFGTVPTVSITDAGGLTLPYKDLYSIVMAAFQEWWYVLLYVVSMFAIGFHLLHGFESAFQTLGINHPKYTPTIKIAGRLFAIAIPAAFALIPLIVFFTK